MPPSSIVRAALVNTNINIINSFLSATISPDVVVVDADVVVPWTDHHDLDLLVLHLRLWEVVQDLHINGTDLTQETCDSRSRRLYEPHPATWAIDRSIIYLAYRIGNISALRSRRYYSRSEVVIDYLSNVNIGLKPWWYFYLLIRCYAVVMSHWIFKTIFSTVYQVYSTDLTLETCATTVDHARTNGFPPGSIN